MTTGEGIGREEKKRGMKVRGGQKNEGKRREQEGKDRRKGQRGKNYCPYLLHWTLVITRYRYTKMNHKRRWFLSAVTPAGCARPAVGAIG